jgi:uncharacterized membrane protein YeaQ/YmgE (transglycosylase-associated protein family)
MLITIIAWLVLGAIAGYIAGFLMKGDEGLGIIGHVILGIVGAVVGGFLASLLGLNTGTEDGDVINVVSIVVAVIGAIVVLAVASFLMRSRGSSSV